MNLLDALEDFTVRGDPDKDLAKVILLFFDVFNIFC